MASDNKHPAFDFNTIIKSYPDIFEQIVKNIPLHLRWDVAAVNRDFYAMICKMDSKKHQMAIKGAELRKNILESDQMASILNSGRTIDELKISNLNFNPLCLKQLTEIAEKYKRDIKKLHWKNCLVHLQISIAPFCQLLEKFTNLQELDACGLDFYHVDVAFNPVLKSLKSFIGDCFFISRFIAKDTLREFSHCGLGYGMNNYFVEAFRNQANLTSIAFSDNSSQYEGEGMINANCYRHMNRLEKFDFNQSSDEIVQTWFFRDIDFDDKDVFIQQLIRDHPNLRELNFIHGDMRWNSTTLSTIGEHGRQLEKLQLSMDDENCRNFLQLRHLKHLKEIEISIDADRNAILNDGQVDEGAQLALRDALINLSKLDMLSVKKLTFTTLRPIIFGPEEILINFGNHWSNVEEFAYQDADGANPIVIDTIMRNFRKLKSLELNGKEINADGKIYPQFTKLKLNKTDETSIFNLMEAFPNVTDLEISINLSDFNLRLMVQRLSSIKKLRKLTLGIFLQWTDEMSSNSDFYDAIRNLCQGVSNVSMWLEDRNPESFDKLIAYWSKESDFCKINVNWCKHRIELIKKN